MANALIIPKVRVPIVLVHGLFGFDRIRLAGLTIANYFPGIPECLQAAGNRVLIPSLSPTAGVAERARQLKEYLERESPGEPVHLFAHSMGGLDSRYMVSRLGMAERVLTLTSLGTPHRGTSFADWGIGRLERLVKPIFSFLGIPTQAFYDLTTASCRTFNDQVPDDPRVRYFSVAGRHDSRYLHPGWLLPHSIVQQAEGPNDGVVSVASATYGETMEIWEGDHFSLVNWLHPWAKNRTFGRDPILRYGPLVRRLKDEGY
ncbi:MAG TPA: alpha/beta fold hydrolase [Gemmataceae bacterium]|nr:alpha/beta fold hydrolase [Gemmataceae bacterium]